MADLSMRTDLTTIKMVEAGSTGEAICGIGAIALAVLSIIGILPYELTSIAAIGIGAGLLIEGSAIAIRESEILKESMGINSNSVLTGGISAEIIGGLAGVALGVLALVGIATTTLLPVAAIVFGATLLLGSRATSRMDYLRAKSGNTGSKSSAMLRSATGGDLLLGLGSIVLGILELVGVGGNPILLSEIAILTIAVAELWNGSAIFSKMYNLK